MAILGTAYIYVTGVAEREGDQWVSFCKKLGTASGGDTPEEALANLDEAVQVYLETLAEYGELDRVFGERGIAVGRDVSTDDLVPHRGPERKLGALTGKLWIAPDSDETPPDLIQDFEGR